MSLSSISRLTLQTTPKKKLFIMQWYINTVNLFFFFVEHQKKQHLFLDQYSLKSTASKSDNFLIQMNIVLLMKHNFLSKRTKSCLYRKCREIRKRARSSHKNSSAHGPTCILPYFGKRKQVTKVTFLVKEENVSVISTDINGISCLTSYIS